MRGLSSWEAGFQARCTVFVAIHMRAIELRIGKAQYNDQSIKSAINTRRTHIEEAKDVGKLGQESQGE